MTEWNHESAGLFRGARQDLSPSMDNRDRVRARLAEKLGTAALGMAMVGTVAAAKTAAASAASAGTGAAGAAGTATSAATKGAALLLFAKFAVPIVLAGTLAVVGPRAFNGAKSPAQTADPQSHAQNLGNAPREVAPASQGERADVPSLEAPAGSQGERVDVPNLEAPAASQGERPDVPSLEAPAASQGERADVPRLEAKAPHAVLAPPPGEGRRAFVDRVETPETSAEAVPHTDAPHQSPAPAPVVPSEIKDEEARLIGALDGALRSGDPTRASRLAEEHSRRFPNGVLAEEREGGQVLAHCMSGNAAFSGAAAFLAAHPRTPLRARIEAGCSLKAKEQ